MLELEKLERVVADVFRIVDGEVSGLWKWRRNLFVWEETLLADLLLIVNRNFLPNLYEDRWVWSSSKYMAYLTKEDCSKLVKDIRWCSRGFKIVDWTDLEQVAKWLSLKINAFAWKLMLDRLPSLTNLNKCKFLSTNEKGECRLCDRNVELVTHFFFSVWVCFVSLEIDRFVVGLCVWSQWRSCRYPIKIFPGGFIEVEDAVANFLVWYCVTYLESTKLCDIQSRSYKFCGYNRSH